MKRKILLTMTLFALAATLGFAKKPAERWSEEKANAWMAKQGWIVGLSMTRPSGTSLR